MLKKILEVPVIIMIFATMLMLVSGVSSFAQPIWLNNSTKDMPTAFMEHEDANSDGKVTIDEFKGPDNEFNFFDRNGDGIIEISEAPTPDTLPEGFGEGMQGTGAKPLTIVTINGVKFEIPYDVFPWAKLPTDVIYERQPVQSYTNSEGVTHYYEAVYVSSGNLNWYQAAYLAQEAGGYLASITSKGENTFVFNLVSDEKYFYSFPKMGKHYGVSIGPFLGGYQPEGSVEPAGGWRWLSGETWSYSNWCVDEYCDSSRFPNCDGKDTKTKTDQDPRPNNQPNDSGTGQAIMGFGEMNIPVATWGDYMGSLGTYGGGNVPGAKDPSYGFVIEYENNP